MVGFTQTQKAILGKYTRAIIHMRKRLTDLKFSLVFGAGISGDFGIPDWDTLINNIANDNLVRGQKLLEINEDRPHTSKTQVLFHHFAAKLSSKKRNNELNEGEIKNEWRNIVRKHLYRKGKSIEQIKRGNHYIKSFIEIIKKCPMTVTYNFDDYIERILHSESTKERIYETTWDPQLQSKFNKCVIYHPNGFLPKRKLERQSEGLVFCEDEFADQLIESMAGRYASLLHHYSQNTCLFLGLSLEDSTLKHLLRQSAKLNPGHYHYYVYYLKNDQKLSIKEQDAIYEANFNLYNLITLFLTNKEIKELAGLIQLDNERFIIKAHIDNIKLIYCYYVVGAIGVGKSTIISYFRNLFTHDEWPNFRIPELGKDWESLSQRQKDKVNNWIAGQFKKKNLVLHDSAYGIHIIDRAPLDPLAFTSRNERKQKANFLVNSICDEEVGIKAGHIILLLGDPENLEKRARSSDKEYAVKKLDDMQKVLQRIYYSKNKLSIVNTKNKRLEKTIKEIGKIIHKLDYREINLNLRLNNIKGGRYKC